MRVVRYFHAGRDAAHRERDSALVRAGMGLTLIVPSSWPGADDLRDDPFPVVEVPVRRAGDVNRHTFVDVEALARRVRPFSADIVDLHAEPFSALVHQVLRRQPRVPVVTYTAQNLDKRFPPPYAQWEKQALRRIDGIYPCSRQAASVVVGKGFRGEIEVLPLPPSASIVPGQQRPPEQVRLLLVGRFVPNKGIRDAVHVLAQLRETVDATLELVGAGPEEQPARDLAAELGVADALVIRPWLDASALAERYAAAHVLLAPSRSTRTWVEQFGRMVVEAQAAGVVVVGYASGSLPEVVADAGVLVPEGDVDALAAAVRRLVCEPARWQQLRKAGLAAARTRTWDEVAKGQIDLYERVLAASGPRLPVRPQRELARERYGPPARVGGDDRPFALPVLRDHPDLFRPLAKAIDLAAKRERTEPGRIRVVFLDHVARMSGGELALLRLIEALDGVDAHVILAEDGPLHAALVRAGATVEILELDPLTRELHRDQLGGARSVLASAAYVRRLAGRLRELEPDLVHTNSLKSGYYGATAARLAGLPVIWHLRDRVAADYLPSPVVRLTRGLLAALPTLVVSNSAETMRTAGRRVRLGAVVNSPVIHDPYAPRRVGARRSTIDRIGIVGRLAEWKGQHVFLQALAELRRDHPLIHGVIVGSALFGEHEYEADLHRLVAELGLGENVTFTGFVDDIESELAELDVLVHASVVPEPFGQVVVEGMAAGLPVVATNAGGPQEIITNDVDGLLVAPDSVSEMVAALRRLADDPELRARLGDAGRIRAANFAPDVIGRRMREIYVEVLRLARPR